MPKQDNGLKVQNYKVYNTVLLSAASVLKTDCKINYNTSTANRMRSLIQILKEPAGSRLLIYNRHGIYSRQGNETKFGTSFLDELKPRQY